MFEFTAWLYHWFCMSWLNVNLSTAIPITDYPLFDLRNCNACRRCCADLQQEEATTQTRTICASSEQHPQRRHDDRQICQLEQVCNEAHSWTQVRTWPDKRLDQAGCWVFTWRWPRHPAHHAADSAQKCIVSKAGSHLQINDEQLLQVLAGALAALGDWVLSTATAEEIGFAATHHPLRHVLAASTATPPPPLSRMMECTQGQHKAKY